MKCARSVLHHGIWGQLVYFWTAKIQLGQLCSILFLWLSQTKCFISFFFFFSDPHQVILIRAPPNDSVVWLPCPFQTVGWSYHTIVATLRTHLGGNAPSVSRVGSNQTRELTVTISRMKMLFASGELCPLLPVTLSCCSPDRERVKTELNTGGS